MKIWVDDVRQEPRGYIRFCDVNSCIKFLNELRSNGCISIVEVLDLDHDAGDFAVSGGDYINILNWLEEVQVSVPIRIHSFNSVGVENMRRIIETNNWKEIR